MQEEEWRVEVRFGRNLESAELRELEFASGVPGGARRHGHDVTFYSPEETAARRFIAAAGPHGGELLWLEKWSAVEAEWQPIAEGMAGEQARRTNASSSHSAWIRRPWVIGALVAWVLITSLLFYFVPGSAGTSNAGRHHDLGRTISLTFVSLLVAGFCWSRFGRRSG